MNVDKNITLEMMSAKVNNVNIDDEILVFDTANPLTKLSHPLRFEAMLIALVRGGSGSMEIDLRKYNLRRNTLMVLHPLNYVYSCESTDDFEMEVVAVSREILETIVPKLTDLMPLLIHHRAEPIEQISERDAEGLHRFFCYLREQLANPRTPFLKQSVICMLQAALFQMLDMQYEREAEVEHKKSRRDEIMAKFILLVSEHFRTERQVSFYARKICITPKHLSAVIKEISGRTASEWIENYVTVEAKVLLKTTDLTVQEIAAKLNFSNQSFFGKYFKHQTGLSPTEYRRKNNI